MNEAPMLFWKDIIKFCQTQNPKPDFKIVHTDQEWKSLLSAEQYRITRDRGTEPAFSSSVCSLFEPGIYVCTCCESILFDAQEKFESGSGWPSFTQPIQDNAIAYHLDHEGGLLRIEATCNCCDAHLGHVFPDGPPPGGLRYCMNAVALKKK